MMPTASRGPAPAGGVSFAALALGGPRFNPPRRSKAPRAEFEPGRAQAGPGRPNSPSLAPPRNASHSGLVKIRAGPWGCRELRIAICPSARKATSTQLPPVGPLWRLLIQLASVRVLASIPLRMLLMGIAPYPRAVYE